MRKGFRHHMKTLLLSLTVAGLLVSTASQAAKRSYEASQACKDSATPSWLFVLSADHAKFKYRNHVGTLILQGVHDHVLYFTDRPKRFAHLADLQSFLSQWDTFFRASAPNGALVHANLAASADKSERAAAFELLSPKKLDEHEWQFEVRTLRGDTDLKDVPRYMDQVNIFIDNASMHGSYESVLNAMMKRRQATQKLVSTTHHPYGYTKLKHIKAVNPATKDVKTA